MSVLNPLARELSAKIVYYGPGLSGKTSSLSFLHSSLRPTHRGELLSLATEGDRTLFFDFLPVHMPRIKGLDLRLQLYTVPGQVFYGATRRLLLEGADGVVFVADSQEAARERNLESLNDLRSNLDDLNMSLGSLPFVLQYNKRDLPLTMELDDMRQELNPEGAPDFATCASSGEGVSDALKMIISCVGKSLAEKEPRSVARPEVGRRLSFDPDALAEAKVETPDGMAAQVSDAITRLGSLRRDSDRVRDVKTIQAPAPSTFSFSSLWEDPQLITVIEANIATGHFAEAVHRAASSVSDILDGLLGPHVAEGSGTRAQLLGLDGREYLELRRLAGRPASTITQNEALFALYLLVAARIKAMRLAPY